MYATECGSWLPKLRMSAVLLMVEKGQNIVGYCDEVFLVYKIPFHFIFC